MFNQQTKINRWVERRAYITELVKGKSVLHLGASDTGLPEASIDNLIRENASYVYSVDIEFPEGFEGDHGIYDLNDDSIEDDDLSNKEFDLIIAGEVLEHLTNPTGLVDFIYSLWSLPWQILITVPNCLLQNKIRETWTSDDGIYNEVIHPGHYCYYTPYTISNWCKTVFKDVYEIEQIVLIDRENSIGVLLKLI